MRWQAITERGIRLHRRTYDCDLLAPYRRQPSPITARGGKWEVHTNPPRPPARSGCACPTARSPRSPGSTATHVHRPFNEQTWQRIRTTVTRHTDPDSLEADLADALDQLMRRTRTGNATAGEQRLLARTQPARTPLPPPRSANSHPSETEASAGPTGPATDTDSLDDFDEEQDLALDAEEDDADDGSPAVPYTGLGLYDARAEALKW
ncbi:hypothetical protein [Streptomyces sp. S465]|uniref:hypothetical protein n=1 Tax=Streptomyces sp. S465 TaxID=2979468 RepID=UPI0022A838A0|nr:hypothetical protein [Streptomyces sp. S465]WAP53475.1 hypothetical protein N6H00_00040 [Streptomyces sp. S465]